MPESASPTIQWTQVTLSITSPVSPVALAPQMRERFLAGAPYAFVHAGRFLDQIVTRVTRRVVAPSVNGRDPLVHCSQEMSQLATFLPRLHGDLR